MADAGFLTNRAGCCYASPASRGAGLRDVAASLDITERREATGQIGTFLRACASERRPPSADAAAGTPEENTPEEKEKGS